MRAWWMRPAPLCANRVRRQAQVDEDGVRTGKGSGKSGWHWQRAQVGLLRVQCSGGVPSVPGLSLDTHTHTPFWSALGSSRAHHLHRRRPHLHHHHHHHIVTT